MKRGLEQQPIVASFFSREVEILKAAAYQLPGVEVVDVHSKSNQQTPTESDQVTVSIKGNLGVLFERADRISAELAKTSGR